MDPEVKDVLLTARNHLRTLRGDPSNMDEKTAHDLGIDMIHWQVMKEINECLRKYG